MRARLPALPKCERRPPVRARLPALPFGVFACHGVLPALPFGAFDCHVVKPRSAAGWRFRVAMAGMPSAPYRVWCLEQSDMTSLLELLFDAFAEFFDDAVEVFFALDGLVRDPVAYFDDGRLRGQEFVESVVGLFDGLG